MPGDSFLIVKPRSPPLNVTEAKIQHIDAHLQKTRAAFDKLTAQLTSEDDFFRYVLNYNTNGFAFTEDIYQSRPHLRPNYSLLLPLTLQA
jgi:hypothetical protein